MEDFYIELIKLNELILLKKSDKWLLLESDGLTYYELRQFLTLLYKNIKDKPTKEILANVLKILTVMEIRKLPVPTIKKLKSASPKIFA